jgi:hypothetical protein
VNVLRELRLSQSYWCEVKEIVYIKIIKRNLIMKHVLMCTLIGEENKFKSV